MMLSRTHQTETRSQAFEPLMDKLRGELAKILAPQPVRLAYLYGSTATGQTTPFSDVDIALVLEADAALPSRLHFELMVEDELAARCDLSQADVRVINEAPLELRGEVVTQGILLYARDEQMRIEFETATRREYFDFQPVAEFFRQAFFNDLRKRGLRGQPRKSPSVAR
jgi:uncharacterized protein